ncbi:DinB family protein [Chitinibacter tainanensis]|uniref:DinB family protein n=1 Tax=Chitinibacter tainanensis TaxID=230667 RepID=UPI0023557661|nr:DinB family protein [Chitinibacter tainanensis]
MFDGNLPQLMAAYNQWQNRQVYHAAAQLSEEQRQADRGAFFRSVHGTLDHLLWGDLIWLGRFTEQTLVTQPCGELLHPDFASLSAAREALDQQLISWAAGLNAEWLAEPITWTSRLYQFTQTVPRWVLVQHMFNHQTHHRGQVGTLLQQLGVEVGITDLPLLDILQQGPSQQLVIHRV